MTRRLAAALIWPDGCLQGKDLEQAVAAIKLALAGRLAGNRRVALMRQSALAQLLHAWAVLELGGGAMLCDPLWPLALRQRVLAATRPAMQISDTGIRTAENDGDSAAPEGAFYIAFTSGSTGLPKAIERRLDSWQQDFLALQNRFGIAADDCLLPLGSLAHSMTFYAAMEACFHGARFAFLPHFSPLSALRLARMAAATILYATPTALLLLLAQAQRQRQQLPQLRLILVGGAKWPQGLAQRLVHCCPRAQVVGFYGASETGFITMTDADTPPGSVGRVLAGRELQVWDRQENALPDGRCGTLWLRGGAFFTRYVMGETAVTQRREDWLTIGDTGYCDEKQNLFLRGRQQRMLICAGHNLFPEVVETVLRQLPMVADAWVYGRPEGRRGDRVCAAIWPYPDQHPTASLLRHFCLQWLSPHEVPQRFSILRRWPLTASGKPDGVLIEQQAEGRQ